MTYAHAKYVNPQVPVLNVNVSISKWFRIFYLLGGEQPESEF